MQSVVNAGGGNSVDLINSSINVQGTYSGSVPQGKATGSSVLLSFVEAMRLGMRNNLGSISQNLNVRQADSQRKIARSTLLPSVNAVVSENEEQINLKTLGVLEPSFPLVAGPFNYFDARGSLDQSLFDLVRIRNLHAASENVTASRQSAKDARDLIVLAVGGSYLQLVASNARILAAQAQVKASGAVYQQAADRLEHGLNARIDVTRTRVQLQTDQQRLRALQAELDREKLNLARAIGLPLGQQFSISTDFPYRPLVGWSVETALARAYKNRSDYQAAESGVRAADSIVAAARAERLPSVRLHADYGAAGLRPDFDDHGVFSVSGTLTIPIYEGGRISADVERANAALQQRRAELEDLRGRIDQDVRRAFIDLDSAADQVEVARSNVDLALETQTQAQDRFVAGVADTVEVVQAEQTVIQANNDVINAVFEHNLAKVSLARAMGGAEQTIAQLLEIP